MPDRTVSVSIVADASNYLANMQRMSTATTGVGKQAQTTGQLTQAFVGKIGNSISSLGNQVGGSVGAVLSTVGNGIDTVASKSAKLSTALTVGGGAAIAAGLGLQQLGSGAQESQAQLEAAISATGDSYSDYEKQVDAAVATNENFGKSAEDTKNALTTLVTATGSTSKALAQMNVTTQLAAAKHESLSSAASAVARVLGGNAGRVLAVYGIQLDGVGTKAEQGQRALEQLSQKLDGQASASVASFGGQVSVATTKVGDFINDAAQPAGIALTAIGGAASATGLVLDVLPGILAKVRAAQAAAAASSGLLSGSLDAEAASATTAAAATGGLAASVAALASGPLGIAVIGGLAVYGANALYKMSDAAASNVISLKNVADIAAQINRQVKDTNTGFIQSGGNAGRVAVLQGTNSGNTAVEGVAKSLGLDSIGGLNQPFETVTKTDAALASLVQNGNAAAAAKEFDLWKASAKDAGTSVSYLKSQFPAYISALDGSSASAGTAATTTGALGSSFDIASAKAKYLKDTTDELEKSLSSYGSTAQSAESATEGYYSALNDATAAAKANGKATDDQTAKGRANNAALYGLASAANAVATANLKAKTPIDQVNASLDKAKSQFITVAENMGYTKTAAEQLSAKLIGVTTTKYNFTLDGVTVATNNLNTFIKALNKIPGKVTTQLYVKGIGGTAIRTGGFVDKNGISHFASGGGYGQFRGPGSGTSDSIPAMVSNGEYINTAATVARLGVGYFQALNRGATPAPRVSAPSVMHVDNRVLNVSLDVSGVAATSRSEFGQISVQAIREGIKNGVIPVDWANRV